METRACAQDDGTECSFRGTFLEVEPPTRTGETWLVEGWPDAEAVESMDLHETDGVTTLTWRTAFKDRAGRAHMTKSDGVEANFDNVEDLLWSLRVAIRGARSACPRLCEHPALAIGGARPGG